MKLGTNDEKIKMQISWDNVSLNANGNFMSNGAKMQPTPSYQETCRKHKKSVLSSKLKYSVSGRGHFFVGPGSSYKVGIEVIKLFSC